VISRVRFADGCGTLRNDAGEVEVVGDPLMVAALWAENCPRHPTTNEDGTLDILHVQGVANEGANEIGVWWNDQYGSTHLRSWEQVHEDLGRALTDKTQEHSDED